MKLDDILDKMYNMKLPSYIDFRTSEGIYRLSPEEFFWILTQVVMNMSLQPLSMTGNKKHPTISQLIYSLVGENKLCTGSLVFNTDKRELNLKSGIISITDKEGMDMLSKKILQKKDTCKNFVISFQLQGETGGHQNIIFLDYGRRIKIYLFEPHGFSDNNMAVKSFLEEFKKSLERIEKRSVILIPKTQISCRIGIQTAMKDKMGFCVTVSFFWIYCLLTLAKDNDLSFITTLEKDIIEKAGNKLGKVIINFAAFFSLYIFEFMKKIGNYELFVTLFEIILQRNSYIKSRFIPKSSPEYFQLGTVPVGKDIYHLRKKGEYVPYIKPRKEKVNDGSECKYNSECLSENCVNNRCVPYKY